MAKYFRDNRWKGNFGIARYAFETSQCMDRLNFSDLESSKNPLSITGLLDWQCKTSKVMFDKDSLLYSPAFVPAVGFNNRQIITVHDLIHLECSDEASSFKKIFYQQVIKPVLQKAPITFTVSEFSKQKICEWAHVEESKIVVTGNAASEIFMPSGEEMIFPYDYVLYVGNTKPHKNIETLFNALQYFPASLHLIIVGDIEDEQRKNISALGVQDRVHNVKDISESDLAKYYRGAKCFVIPSLYEGFGIPVLEAMASGTPVVSSRSASLPEIAQDAALYFEGKDIEELANQIQSAISDSKVRTSLIEKGLSRSRFYNWKDISHKIESELLSLK